MDAPQPWRAAEPLLTSLVLPAYNPGRRLLPAWEELRAFLDQSPRAWEVIFVCDGCTDGTPERLKTLAAADGGRLRVLAHQPNRGKGYAVRRGLEAARGRWLIFTDVDLAYPPSDVLGVAELLWAGADVAIASRSHPDSRVVVPPRLHGYALRRHVQGLLFGWLARRLLPLPQHDTQAGLKGLSAVAARKLLPHLHCDGFGLDCELLTACARLGLEVREAPVCVRVEDTASTTGWRAALATLGELWAVRRRWRAAPAGGGREASEEVPQGAHAHRPPRTVVPGPSSGVA